MKQFIMVNAIALLASSSFAADFGMKVVPDLTCPAGFTETFSCRDGLASTPQARGYGHKRKAQLIICQKNPNEGIVISYYGQMQNDGFSAQWMNVVSRNELSGETMLALQASPRDPHSIEIATFLNRTIKIEGTLIECK